MQCRRIFYWILLTITPFIHIAYSIKYIDKPITSLFQTSVAFYINIGSTHKVNPDLRGNFWEWQLPNKQLNHYIYYITDGPIKLNNKFGKYLHIEARSAHTADKGQCKRTMKGLKHFVNNKMQAKWYFKAVHDTFINITNLLYYLEEIERNHDPMKEDIYVFGAHEMNCKYYPQGGSGFLFSNYAVRKLYEQKITYDTICEYSSDDISIGTIFNATGMNISEKASNRFISTWPYEYVNEILENNFDAFPKCEKFYKMCSNGDSLLTHNAKSAISIHMHGIPMDVAQNVIKKTPMNLGVYFTEDASPRFCRYDI